MPLLSKKSPAAFGLLLCLAALYRCATLSGSGWDHLLVPLAMLSLLILALLLLKRAGFSENALAAALFPLGLAFSLRAFLMPCVTSDYQNFLSHWVEYFPISSITPVVIVLNRLSLTKVTASISSFQLDRKVKIATVDKAGVRRGRIIWKNIL